jgi:hypothetical protein
MVNKRQEVDCCPEKAYTFLIIEIVAAGGVEVCVSLFSLLLSEA